MANGLPCVKTKLALGALIAVALLSIASGVPVVSQKVGYALELLTPAPNVTITVDGVQHVMTTRADTVLQVIEEAQISLGENDRVEPALDTKVVDDMPIVITRVQIGEIVEQERLAFREIRRANARLEAGVVRTVQRGREGQQARHYQVVYENGERVAQTLLRTEVLQPQVDRIVEYGTITSVSRGGTTIRFSRVIYVTATAYTAGPESTGKSPGHPAFGITRSGLPVEVGHIAVDPRVIPLLSQVYVDGLCSFSSQFSGTYLATDTGSAIRGNRIDIYFERVEDAIRFGRRRMRVYILER